jgi:outer membrane lipoprotein-sorting protein
MKLLSNVIFRSTVIVGIGVFGVALASAQAPAAKPLMAEDVFKNVQVMKGIPVDEFMSTMGIFSAALGISCENCHSLSDKSWADYALDATPKKRTARRMVLMMQGINKQYFGGRQVITCFGCHRGGDHPRPTPDLGAIYGAMPEDELDDAVAPAPDQPPADQILDKYIAAIGGAQKVGALTTIVAKGMSSGYGPESRPRGYELYLKAPGMREQIVHTDSGDSIITTDGKTAWISAPLRPVDVLEYSGGEREGAKIDAVIPFATRIKQALQNLHTGAPQIVNDKRALVIQGTIGTGADQTMVTLFFDPETGLLLRVRRYAASIVGRVPTEYDYSDYRDVNGVKLPFKWSELWLDGREDVELSEVQTNVNIDASRFTKPAPPAKK